jgi:hypothetical protein
MIPLPPPQREEVHHELVYFYLVSWSSLFIFSMHVVYMFI